MSRPVPSTSARIAHAWRWVILGPHHESIPVRILYPGTGLFADYTPEYVGI